MPELTVIIPVLDGGESFERCLDALAASTHRDYELVVADDGSTDASASVAAAHGARVVRTAGREGPAAARNLGAESATGDVLVFIDADCSVHPDTLGRVAERFAAEPDLDALFGSYDDTPTAPGLVAQYKNLLHHYTHQHGRREASTFWAGCGAIRRRSFARIGGFDAERFARPSVEDIDLGYRLRAAGGRIALVPEIQVTHHKAWTLGSLVTTDVLRRAVPWARLIAARGRADDDLNLDLRSRASALAALAAAASCGLAVHDRRFLAVAGAGVAALVALNLPLYRFFAAKRGAGFAAAAAPLHWLYLLYSPVGFAGGTALHWLDRRSS